MLRAAVKSRKRDGLKSQRGNGCWSALFSDDIIIGLVKERFDAKTIVLNGALFDGFLVRSSSGCH